MKTRYCMLAVIAGLLTTVGYAAFSNDAWAIHRVIPGLGFGVALSYSLIRRLTTVDKGFSFLLVPLLLLLGYMVVKNGGKISAFVAWAVSYLVTFWMIVQIREREGRETSS